MEAASAGGRTCGTLLPVVVFIFAHRKGIYAFDDNPKEVQAEESNDALHHPEKKAREKGAHEALPRANDAAVCEQGVKINTLATHRTLQKLHAHIYIYIYISSSSTYITK